MRLREFAPGQLNELSPATLASYKKKAGAAATAADAAGDTKTGNKRFSGIVKATKKQFDQDAKGVSEGYSGTEDLSIGDPVIITGKGLEFEGTTGEISAFGDMKRFVVVNLYNHGPHSFHSSDVSFNEYAGSDEEEARMYDAGEFGDDPRDNMNEAAPVYYDTATGKPLPPDARFDPNTGKPLPGVSSAPQAAAAPAQGLAPTKPGLPTPNKSKEAAYAAANKAKAAAPAVAAPAVAAPAVAAPAVAAPAVAAPAAAKPPRDTSKSIYDGDTGELTAYGAELKDKEKVDRQAAYAAAEANKAKAAPVAAPVAAPTSKKVDIVQAAKTAMAAGGNPEAAAIAAMKAKNPKLAAMMAQAGLDDQGRKIAPAAPAPAPVAEDSLAGMKRLAGIASVQTQTIPGQRQYRHMPTAVQPR